MQQDSPRPRKWDRKTILCNALCLLLPFPLPVAHEVFGIGTFSQVAYGEMGIVAVFLCYLMVGVKPGWGKLLAVQAFLALGFLPRLIILLLSGVLDFTLAQALFLLLIPGVFVAVFLLGHWILSGLTGPQAQRFTAFMYILAAGMHAILLPVLLGEPLLSHTIHTTEVEEAMIAVSPDGTRVLTHSALTPLIVTLYAANDGLDVLRHESLPGYPVGIRVRKNHALIALRIIDKEKETIRIDFVRFSENGVETISSYACPSEQNPSHLVNNLSPDGTLLALADGSFVDVETGHRIDRHLVDTDTNLTFVTWMERDGRAVYYDKKKQRLEFVEPLSNAIESYTLRGHPWPLSTLAVFPDGKQVWYEERAPFLWLQGYVENLNDRVRNRLLRNRGRALEGSSHVWTGDHSLTYTTETGTLETHTFDNEHLKHTMKRHTQLYEMSFGAAFASETGWLFWTTQPQYGEGIAIHRKRIP